MGSILKTLLVLCIFVLGVAIGWAVRDYDGHRDAEFKMATQPAQFEAPDSTHLKQLQKLFDTNRFAAAVAGMQGLSAADHETMRTYLYRRAAQLMEQGRCAQQLRLFNFYLQQFARAATGLLLQDR